jgi:hypothetical protein
VCDVAAAVLYKLVHLVVVIMMRSFARMYLSCEKLYYQKPTKMRVSAARKRGHSYCHYLLPFWSRMSPKPGAIWSDGENSKEERDVDDD